MTNRLCLICFLSLFVSGAFGQSRFELLGKADAIVLDMRVNQTSQYIVALTTSDIQQWDFASKKLLRSWPSGSVRSIDLYNDRLAGVSRKGDLFIWDLLRQTEVSYKVPATSLSCLAWIDSEWIIIGSDDGSLLKVHSRTGQVGAHASAGEPVTAVSNGFDGSILVGTEKGKLGIYDAADLSRKNWIKAHKTWIREIYPVDSTESFVTVSDDNFLRRWRASDLTNVDFRIPGSWSVSSDYVPGNEKGNSLAAVGKLDGRIIVNSSFATYSARTDAIVNKICIVRSVLPEIKLIVATHGGGLQIWNGQKMKLKTL